eukprot:g30391.t1
MFSTLCERSWPNSPSQVVSEEEQGQILVERKVEAFRQLAANLDAQVIDQIVDEHNRRLLSSNGVTSSASEAALDALQQELQQVARVVCSPSGYDQELYQELLSLREQELANCQEELQRLREYCAALEERDQKLAAVVNHSTPVLEEVQKRPKAVSFDAAPPSLRGGKTGGSVAQDTNHDGVISKDEFESHSPPGSSSSGGSCMVQLSPQMAQGSLFQRMDANMDGVISLEEVTHCPQCDCPPLFSMVRMVSSLLLVLLPVLYAYRESDSMLSALTRDSKGPESEGDDTDANAMDENKEKEDDSDDQGVLDCHSQLKMPINWKVTFKTIEEMQDKVEKLVRVTNENSDPQDTWGGLAQTEAENEGNIRLFLGAEVWFDGQKKDGKDMLFAIERDLRSCLDLLTAASLQRTFAFPARSTAPNLANSSRRRTTDSWV